MADVFVSYKREDRAAVERTIARLEQEGFSVWWDSQLTAGASFGERIAHEIDEAKCVLVIWSKASVGSKWVYAEATEADSQGKLVPATIEPCRTKPPFNILHSFNLAEDQASADCSEWSGLLKQIRSFVVPGGSSALYAPDHPDHDDKAAASELSFLNFVRIPGGACEHLERQVGGDGATAKIAIKYDFAMGKFAVTVAEWEAAIAEGLTISRAHEHRLGNGKLPMVNVSWDDAMHYASWLSSYTGRTFRLPSEAEWEYACRTAGSKASSLDGNLDPKQFCCRFPTGQQRSAPDGPSPVGSYAPNASGLYDMHGNVWEWVIDCWRPSLANAELDGSPMLDGDRDTRVIRGGSWAHPPEYAGCSARGHARKDSRNQFTGFRLVMECD